MSSEQFLQGRHFPKADVIWPAIYQSFCAHVMKTMCLNVRPVDPTRSSYYNDKCFLWQTKHRSSKWFPVSVRSSFVSIWISTTRADDGHWIYVCPHTGNWHLISTLVYIVLKYFLIDFSITSMSALLKHARSWSVSWSKKSEYLSGTKQ